MIDKELFSFFDLDIHDLLAVVKTAIRADVMQTDRGTAVSTSDDVRRFETPVGSSLSLFGDSSSSCRDCHITPHFPTLADKQRELLYRIYAAK